MQVVTPSDESVVLKLPAGAALAIERAAIQARVTPAQLMRQAMADGLLSWGLQLQSDCCAVAPH